MYVCVVRVLYARLNENTGYPCITRVFHSIEIPRYINRFMRDSNLIEKTIFNRKFNRKGLSSIFFLKIVLGFLFKLYKLT